MKARGDGPGARDIATTLTLPRKFEEPLAPVRSCATGPVYLVGGFVRDLLLGRETADIDLACSEPSKTLASRIARRIGGTLVTLDEETKVYRVIVREQKYHYDIAQIQGRTIEEDLLRRDFTINALASPLVPHPPLSLKGEREGMRGNFLSTLIDLRHGLKDLRRRTLCADRPDVFTDDPLRLLRAFRIAAQLEFKIEPATLRHIWTNRSLIQKSAGERIRQELMALLDVQPSHPWLRLMDQAGLLTALFPVLEASRRCAEVYYGKGGVLKHTLDAVERMDILLAELDSIFPDIAPDIREHFETSGTDLNSQAPLLRLAALLHDIAKPATARKIGGRLRFFKHESRGARMAADILRKFRFSSDEIESAAAFIRHHLRPGNLAANPVVSDKAIFRFFSDLKSHGVGLTLVCWADHASYLSLKQLRGILPYACKDPHTFPLAKIKNAGIRKTLRHIQVLHYLLQNYFRRRERILPQRILDGNEIMKTLKIPPSPLVGEILTKLQEAQAEGKVLDREAAVRFVEKLRIPKHVGDTKKQLRRT